MPDLKNLLFRFYLKQYFPPDFSAARSLNEQGRIFSRIIGKLSSTAIGENLGLNEEMDYAAFSTTVPLTQYSFYEPYVERIKAGEQNVMTYDRVTWFGKTAGTTSGKSKLVPISASIIEDCYVRGTFYGLSRLHSFDEDIDILSHKNFAMTGGVYETLEPSGITVADVSAIMMRNVPLPFRTIYTPDNALITHTSWEHKLNTIPGVVKDADVGSMIGVPTWHLAILTKLHAETGFEKLTDLWPNLRIFFHGGVNFEPYREHFKQLVGRPDFIFYENYNATEGFFGIQENPEGGDMLLLTDVSVFYEFIPFAEYGNTGQTIIPLAQVQSGVPYVLVITAINGLFRYVIGDVITFAKTNPFAFRITGRTQEYINAFGEDLLLSNVVNALMQANEKFKCAIKEYTVAPLYIHLDQKGKMQFAIEFSTPPENLSVYQQELDVQLQKENSNYAQKRNNSMALEPLQVIPVPEGAFYRWLESKGKLGGQNKVPRLVNGRKVMDEILTLIK